MKRVFLYPAKTLQNKSRLFKETVNLKQISVNFLLFLFITAVNSGERSKKSCTLLRTCAHKVAALQLVDQLMLTSQVMTRVAQLDGGAAAVWFSGAAMSLFDQ